MSEAVAPITAKDRVGELDVLRGFALLGVMTINLWEFGGESVTITADQLAALPNAALNSSIEFWLRLFVSDKANTLFACLFGMGFWIQMERLEARGAPFRSIYFRRAGILLIFGWLHFFLLFSWDVLHVYGIAAFILLFSRKLSARTMLVVGGALLLFAKPLISGVFEWSGVSVTLDAITSADSEVLARQAAAQSGDFVTFMSLMAGNNWLGWIMNGGLVAWIAYATGRFYIGAWIARKGWIQNASTNLAPFRRVLWPTLVLGLALEATHLLTENAEPGTTLSAISAWGGILHALATPLTAGSAVCFSWCSARSARSHATSTQRPLPTKSTTCDERKSSSSARSSSLARSARKAWTREAANARSTAPACSRSTEDESAVESAR